MSKLQRIDFDVLRRLVLFVLVQHFESGANRYLEFQDIAQKLADYGPNPISEMLSELKNAELVTFSSQGGWRVLMPGVEVVYDWPENVIVELAQKLESDVADAKGHVGTEQEEQGWVPLQIDRASNDYSEMVHATEEAIEIIAGDNGYAANLPEERAGILNSLQGTLKSIKEGLPSLGAVKVGLLAPLRFIAEKFVGTGMGEAAKRAVDAIASYFGF